MNDRDDFYLEKGFPPPSGCLMPHLPTVRVRCLNPWSGVVGVSLMSLNCKTKQTVPLTKSSAYL